MHSFVKASSELITVENISGLYISARVEAYDREGEKGSGNR